LLTLWCKIKICVDYLIVSLTCSELVLRTNWLQFGCPTVDPMMASPYAVESVPRATNTTTQRLKALTICLLPTPNILASLSSFNGDVKFDEATRPAAHLLHPLCGSRYEEITHVSHHDAVLQPLLFEPPLLLSVLARGLGLSSSFSNPCKSLLTQSSWPMWWYQRFSYVEIILMSARREKTPGNKV
jgi:hypothetical protein